MTLIARSGSSTSSKTRWVEQATASPAGRLVASAPLPQAVYASLVRSRPDLHEALSANRWLSPEARRALYGPNTPVEVACRLLDAALDSESVDHVLDTARERRGEPLVKLLCNQNLTDSQRDKALKRVRSQESATRLLHADALCDAKKVELFKWLDPRDVVLFAANHEVRVDDETLWAAMDATASLADNNHVAALVRILRRRPALLGRACVSPGAGLLIAAATQVTAPHEQLALLEASKQATDVKTASCEVAAILCGRTDVTEPVRAVAHRVAPTATDAPLAGVLATCDDHGLLDTCLKWLSAMPMNVVRAFWPMELARNPHLSSTQQAWLIRVIADKPVELSQWCGPDVVSLTATLLMASAASEDLPALVGTIDRLGSISPGDKDQSANQRHRSYRVPAASPPPAWPAEPDALETTQLLMSLVGGGHAWGMSPGAVGAVITQAIGDDPFAWEVLLGLCDSFHGTVSEMLAVAQASVQR